MVEKGQKEEAVNFIFNAIVDYAKGKEFEKADELRAKLIEVNSMALNEIIKSGEIIDLEKSKAIDPNHKKTWKDFYDTLSVEEGLALYFSMKNIKIGPDKTIIKQGKLNNKLFFVDKGILKVVYHKNGRELYLKKIVSGEVSGTDTFYSISVATTSTITVEPSNLRYIERDDFEKIVEKHAGFDNKMEEFCKSQVRQKTEEIIKKIGVERRAFQRYKTSGKIAVYRFDNNSQPVKKPIYAILEDLSETGMSFCIKSPNKEAARQFLGKVVMLRISFEKTGKELTKKGIILSVFDMGFNDYSVGLRFSKPIPWAELHGIIGRN